MSRSGYIDDCYMQWDYIKWRGQVASVIKGKYGQTFLLDLYRALDAMPEKRLTAGALEAEDGEVCALGALGKTRGLDMKEVDVEDYDAVADMFDVAHQLSREVVYVNDEYHYASPEERYEKVKAWVLKHILPVPMEEAA